MFKRLSLLFLSLLMGLALLVGMPVPAQAATEGLPDLQMGKLVDLSIQSTSDGRRLLRFTARIINMGAGPFEVNHQRANSTSTDWTHTQNIYNTDHTLSRSIPATGFGMIFAGDGHNHWHITDLESYQLERLDSGPWKGLGVKSGFCFFDNYNFKNLPGHPASAIYVTNSCGSRDGINATDFTMGLSVGWGDEYNATLPDQYINITGLTSGRYRLTATADAKGWFTESSKVNNSSWVEFQLKGSSLKVTSSGGYPLP